MPTFHVTIRYGERRVSYHTFEVEAADLKRALERAAQVIPTDIGTAGTLVEIRRAVDPEARPGG